jgi:hypothetical protein
MGVAGAIIAGSAIAAGGALGAAAMSDPKGNEAYSQGLYDPTSQNPLGIGQFWLSALMGLYDPSLLQQAGPLDSAMAKFRTSPFPYGAGRSGGQRSTGRVIATKGYYASYEQARDRGLSSRDALWEINTTVEGFHAWPGMANEAFSFGGYNTIQELFEAEYEHQQRIRRVGAIGEELAGVKMETIVNSINKISEIVADTPGMDQGKIDEYKAAELLRINQELDTQVEAAQRRANVGGYNPGREIEEVEKRRQDADSVALERALAMIRGEQGIAGTSIGQLQQGSGLEGNIGLAGNITQASLPIPLGGGATNFNAGAQQAGYVADAAGALGSGIGNAALAYGMGKSPGYTQPVEFSPATRQTDFPILYG